MSFAIALALLALGVATSALLYRLVKDKPELSGPLSLAAAVIALFATLAAYPMENSYISAFGQGPVTPPGGGGVNPPAPSQGEPSGISEAWGPARTMYTENKPASAPAINSISDNSFLGDERAFMAFKNTTLNHEDGHWSQSGEVKPGNTYIFRIWINAAGADELKSADLQGVMAHVRMPTEVGGHPNANLSGTEQYCGFLSASNAQPPQVWSCGVLLSRTGVRLLPNPTSVKVFNNYFGTPDRDPLEVGASIFTNKGQTLGYDAMNGTIPSGYRYSMFLYFEVRAEEM